MGFERLGLELWVFRFWGFEGFGVGFLGLRKSTSLKPPEESEGGREVERPREEAKEAMSVLRWSMLLVLFEGFFDFFLSAIAGCGR